MATRGVKSTHYDTVMAHMFEKLVQAHGEQDFYHYTKSDLVDAMEELKAQGAVKHISNIPDIKYTYDARRDFPLLMTLRGFWGITGVGKSKYRLEKIPFNNLIRYPSDFSSISIEEFKIQDVTPPEVRAVLGNDEQATMTALRYNDVISHFLGMETFQVQGHERTTVSCGQIEVDEVYVGKSGNEKYVIPISAKGGDKDCLSYTQALNLSLYAKEKSRYSGYSALPLGVLRTIDDNIIIVQFSFSENLKDMKILKVSSYIIN